MAWPFLTCINRLTGPVSKGAIIVQSTIYKPKSLLIVKLILCHDISSNGRCPINKKIFTQRAVCHNFTTTLFTANEEDF